MENFEKFKDDLFESVDILSGFVDECSDFIVAMNQGQDEIEFKKLRADIAYDLFCMGQVIKLMKQERNNFESSQGGEYEQISRIPRQPPENMVYHFDTKKGANMRPSLKKILNKLELMQEEIRSEIQYSGQYLEYALTNLEKLDPNAKDFDEIKEIVRRTLNGDVRYGLNRVEKGMVELEDTIRNEADND